MSQLLTIRGLRKEFGSLTVLNGLDLDVSRGEVIGFIGSSGSGKSTFLRCINLLEMPTDGDIRLDGELIGFEDTAKGRRPLPGRRISQQRGQMAMVFQNFNLWPHKTALENVTEGLIVVKKVAPSLAAKKGNALLARVGLSDKAQSYPSRLSGGQQQRVAIARALALEPKILLFDEPTSALDPELVNDVLKVIRELADEGMTMIIVTHEMRFARDVCDRILFLEKGSIADSGPPAHIFGESASARTKAFIGNYIGSGQS
jgi:polar amino acid transport system ATP-binding protein